MKNHLALIALVMCLAFCGTVHAQGGPLAMLFNPPICTTAPVGSTFGCNATIQAQVQNTASLLAHYDGIVISVPWNTVDLCSVTASCSLDTNPSCIGNSANCYQWVIVDNILANYALYINLNTGCVRGSCKFALAIEGDINAPSTNGTSFTPIYVVSPGYALSLGPSVPPNDVSWCAQDTGAPTGQFSGTAPCGNSLTGTQACMANATGACAAFGGASCTNNAATDANLNGFVVPYEIPRNTAYQQFITSPTVHYSSSGLGSGPTYASHLAYIRVGFTEAAENDPTCTIVNSVIVWAGPEGMGNEPQGFSKAGYLSSWGGSDGLGYVPAFYQFLQTLQASSGIQFDSSAHYGPPNNGDPDYSTDEAQNGALRGIGFGDQSCTENDLLTTAAGTGSTMGWVANAKAYPRAWKHCQFTASSGSSGTSHAVASAITNIVVSGGIGTATLTNDDGGVELCGGVAFVAGNSTILNGYHQIIAGGTCTPGSVTFSTTAPSGTYTGGTLYHYTYWPALLPFMTQMGMSAVEFQPCDAGYAFGLSMYPNVPCGGNQGPDSTWQTALTNMLANTPNATSQIVGSSHVVGQVTLI